MSAAAMLPGLVEDLLRRSHDLPAPAILGVAALAGLVETLIPPFPSEGVLLVLAFAWARRGAGEWPLIGAAAAGSFVSLYVLYLIGRGPLQGPVRRFIVRRSGRADRAAGRFFGAWGIGAVLVSRFLPAVRGPLTFLAGAYGLHRGRVALALGAGCLVWNALVIEIGYRSGGAWNGTAGGLAGAGLVMAAAMLGLWGLGLFMRRRMERPRGT